MIEAFLYASPVWPVGLSRDMNVLAGFRAVIPRISTVPVLRLVGATLYRVSMNGAFLAHGPARAARGFYGVDEIR